MLVLVLLEMSRTVADVKDGPLVVKILFLVTKMP